MKNLRSLIYASAALMAAAYPVKALNYTNTDLLLVFRQSGYNDVEFDIGSVSNYLGLPAGTVRVVTDWSLPLVLSNNLESLNGVSWAVLAATTFSPAQLSSDADWLTCAASTAIPSNISRTAFSAQSSIIQSIGINAATNTIEAGQTNQYYVASETTVGSYSYQASGGNQGDTSTLDGDSSFSIEQTIPGVSRFFQIGTSNPPPTSLCTEVGAFSMDTNGVLTFIAGAVPSSVPAPTLSITRTGTTNVISFPSTNYINYRLFYSATVGGTFTSAGSVLAGNNGTLSFTNVAATNGFYSVEAFY